MSRGGLRPRSKDGSLGHLMQPKWNLGKTTAIRIPLAIKEHLLELAKYLDNSKKVSDSAKEIIAKIDKYDQLVSELNNSQLEIKKLQQEVEKLSKQNQTQNNSSFGKRKTDKYQIAVECFEEYVEKQNLKMENLSKERKGTKKHQLWEIQTWLKSKT